MIYLGGRKMEQSKMTTGILSPCKNVGEKREALKAAVLSLTDEQVETLLDMLGLERGSK